MSYASAVASPNARAISRMQIPRLCVSYFVQYIWEVERRLNLVTMFLSFVILAAGGGYKGERSERVFKMPKFD